MRNLPGTGNQIVGQARGKGLAISRIDHLLEDRAADPLRHPPMNLTLHDHRIDQRSTIVNRQIINHRQVTGGEIDVNDGYMSRVRVTDAGVHLPIRVG